MSKTLSYVLVLSNDGTINRAACMALHEEVLNSIAAEIDTDFATVAVDMTAFLLENPGMKTIATSSLVRALHERKLESGFYVHAATVDDAGNAVAEKPFTRQEKDLAFARLETVVPEYVKSLPDQFHTGKKTGIAIRFVTGETAKDKDGNDVYDAQGDTVQAMRHDSETWAKITAPSEKELAKRAKAAEDAKLAATKAAK
jgi:hypothetical protein